MARRKVETEAPTETASGSPARLSRIRDWISLGALERGTNTLRTVLINAVVLVAFVLLLPVLVGQFRRDQVIIEPIDVPEAVAARGLTASVVSSRLWDGLLDVERQAKTSKASISALPDSRRIEFSFPDSGFSVESLIYHVRKLFNAYETRIGGEITCASADCSPEGMRLRLRVLRAGVDLVDLPPIGARSERDYFADAASGVLAVLDPFVAISAASAAEPLRATILARRLIRSRHPDAHWAHNLIGNIRVNAGDLAGAIAEYRAALDLQSGFAVARSNLGDALRKSGDLAGAQAELDAVLQARPDDPFALAAVAELRLAKGNRDGAVAALEKAAQADPLEPRYPTRAGQIEMDAGHEAEARANLRQALEIDPGYLPAFALLAAMDLAKDDFVSAEKTYRDAADYAPDDAEAQMAHARILAILKNWDQALARYQRAASLVPESADYRLQLGRCLQQLGRHEDALKELALAERLAPDNADIAMAQGDSLRELGRKPEAVAAYRRFLALDGGSLMRPIAERYIQLLSS